jgi:hypothetical protein
MYVVSHNPFGFRRGRFLELLIAIVYTIFYVAIYRSASNGRNALFYFINAALHYLLRLCMQIVLFYPLAIGHHSFFGIYAMGNMEQT